MFITKAPTPCKHCRHDTFNGDLCPTCAKRMALSIVARHRIHREKLRTKRGERTA
jgi:hypothetical protein